jgi:hypothetical protein
VTEGITLNMALSAATLLSVAGLALKFWTSTRATKIGPQPLEVQATPRSVGADICNERHVAIQSDHVNLFARMGLAEQRIAHLDATIQEMRTQYASIDNKLTELLRRWP